MPLPRPTSLMLASVAVLLGSCGPPPPARASGFDPGPCLSALRAHGLRGGLPEGLDDRSTDAADADRATAVRECGAIASRVEHRRCAADRPYACFALGLHETARGELERGRRAFARACDGDVAYACFLAGVIEDRSGADAEAERHLMEACDGHVPAACGAWAMRRPGREDIVTGACAAGYLPACRRISEEPVPAVAATAARELCEAGGAPDCERAVREWVRSEPAPFGAEIAAALAQRACAAGRDDLCGASAEALASQQAQARWRARCQTDVAACIADLELAYAGGVADEAARTLVAHCADGSGPEACAAACAARGQDALASLTRRCAEGLGEACQGGAALLHAGCGVRYDALCERRYVFGSCDDPGVCPAWRPYASTREVEPVACPLDRSLALRLHDARSIGEVAAALREEESLRLDTGLRDLAGAAPRVFPSIDAGGRWIAVPEPVEEERESALRVLRTRSGSTIQSYPIWEPPPPGGDLDAHIRETIQPLYAHLPQQLRTFRPMRRVAARPEGRRAGVGYRREPGYLEVSARGRHLRVHLPSRCPAGDVRVWLDIHTRWVLVEHRACGEVAYHTGRLDS